MYRAAVVADGLVSYSVPRGERRGGGVELDDRTYDGNVTADGRRLTGGLGQLVDGDEGQSNFRLDPLQRGVRGYEWIGWKNDSFSKERSLELIFRWPYAAAVMFTSTLVGFQHGWMFTRTLYEIRGPYIRTVMMTFTSDKMTRS